jgi:hypothetical protein
MLSVRFTAGYVPVQHKLVPLLNRAIGISLYVTREQRSFCSERKNEKRPTYYKRLDRMLGSCYLGENSKTCELYYLMGGTGGILPRWL